MKLMLTLAAILGISLPPLANADPGLGERTRWLVRVRTLNMQVDKGNSTTAIVPALGMVQVEKKIFPEFDVSYFFSPRWAAQLVLTYPQEHDGEFAGVGIGEVTHLPPTLSLQYHLRPDSAVRPYLGAGINYTHFSSDLDAAPAVGVTAPLDLDRSSWGLAAQAGLDLRLAPRRSVNLDAKYAQIEASDIRVCGGTLAGTTVTDLVVDPLAAQCGRKLHFLASGSELQRGTR